MSNPRQAKYRARQKARAVSALAFFGDHCHLCSVSREEADGGLHFAHRHGCQTPVVGMGRGSVERYKDVQKNPGSYILLCVPCHRQYDSQAEAEAGADALDFGDALIAKGNR